MIEVLPARRLTLPGKLGFTIGDYAANLYWQSVTLFLLFFYTDVAGLSAVTAGLIYMVASIWDGVLDPVMGAIAERTRTRWGRYRPYLLFGPVPLAISFALLYFRPPLEGWALAAFLLATHVLFRTCFTAVGIPYTSLNARIVSSSAERSGVAGFRMIFATLGGLTVAFLTQPLVKALGGANAATGFLYTACIFGGIAAIVTPIVFLSTREPPEDPDAPPPPRLRDMWVAIRSNRAFWVVMAAITCAAMSSTALGKSVLYYFKYYLGNEAAARYALAGAAAEGLIAIPAWVFLTRFIGKRNVWFVGVAWGLLGLIYFALVDIRTTTHMIVFLLYMQVATIGLSLTFWSMLPDTVEYGQWKNGIRTEAFIFGLGQFFLKVSLGLGAGLFGAALGTVGYRAGVAQASATLHGMKFIMIAFPAVGLCASAIVMWFHPLRRGVHEEIVRQLAALAKIPNEASASGLSA